MKKPNFKKVTSKSVVSDVLLPVACAMGGSVVGAAAGKTYNLGVALALGVAGIAFSSPQLTYAAAGAAVVTPSASVATPTAGLDGFKEYMLDSKNRGLSQVKSLFSNARLDVVADKIPVSGLAGLGEVAAYHQGYVEGVEDTVDQYGTVDTDSLSGAYNYGTPQLPASPNGVRMSIESVRMAGM